MRMITSAQKYTEEQYLFYEELQERFLPIQLEVIWKEIQTYRQLFLLPLASDAYVIYHLKIQIDHARIVQKLQRLLREQEGALTKPRHVSEEAYGWVESRYQTRMTYPLAELLQEMMITRITQEFLAQYEKLPLLVRVFVVQQLSDERIKEMMMLQLLFEGQLPWDLLAEIHVVPFGKDATKSFHQWLLQVELCIEEQFKKIKQREEAHYLKELRLLERYPTLKAYQAEFFEQHRKPGHYYTVEQFLHYCNTCYETARMSMEQFVRLGWYQKEKCGKKYVYSVK